MIRVIRDKLGSIADMADILQPPLTDAFIEEDCQVKEVKDEEEEVAEVTVCSPEANTKC